MPQSHIAGACLAPDLVEHELHADAPDRLWVADITPAFPEDPGLNREELRRCRWKTHEILETLACVYVKNEQHPAKTKAAEKIRAMMDAGSEYAGMVRCPPFPAVSRKARLGMKPWR